MVGEMDLNNESRSRRSLLTAAAAAGGALAAQVLVRPAPVAAATVTLGALNHATATTTFRNLQAATTAVALKGVVAHTGAGGGTVGVWGQTHAQNGTGVFGIAGIGNSRGVWGRSLSGRGVYGEASGTSGTNYGVVGESKSTNGVGVRGSGSIAIQGEGTGYGVYATGATGVFGSGTTGLSGVGSMYGVYGSSSSYGVVGSGNSFGGYFFGNVHVQGTLSKSGGTFLIDHPQDPANRTLAHAFVESPEMLNVYSGTITLDARGRATIRLPRYFDSLNDEFRYQLTALDAAAPGLHVSRRVERNRFAIAGGNPGQDVCWIVTGVRKDAWAKANPVRVERRKRRKDRGTYLNPDVHGQPLSAGTHRLPKVPRRARKQRTN
jgi:hypothetical protein